MPEHLLHDLRLARRSLARSPWFTIPVVAALGLGLALLATTVAVVNAYLVRSLPYPGADRLHNVVYAPAGTPEPRGISALDWRELADIVTFADSSAITRIMVIAEDATEEWNGVLAAPGTIEAFGMRVALGRGFVPEDFDRGGEPVVLIGESFWRTRFGGDSSIVGRTVLAQPASDTAAPSVVRIAGIVRGDYLDLRAPARGPIEVLTPMRGPGRTYKVRLRAGVPAQAAERRLTEAVRAVATALPEPWHGVRLESVNERYARALRPVLVTVTAAAVMVLMIVCANVAVLMLLRALRRQTEVAVRIALGAGTRHVLRLVAAEAALVCGAALVLALMLSAAALRLIAPAIEAVLGLPVPRGVAAMGIDPGVAAVVIAFGVGAAVLLSAVPLVAPWHRRLTDTLRRGGRAATDTGAMRRLRTGLVVGQLAVSVALAVGCGLSVRGVLHLLRTELGIETNHVLRARVVPPLRGYPDSPALNAFTDRLLANLQARSRDPVALSGFPVLLQGAPVVVQVQEAPDASSVAGSMAVSDQLFPLLGIRVLRGRAFVEGDRETSEPVAIVSETLARRLFPATEPLGRRIRGVERHGGTTAEPWRTVVGVVSDVRQAYTDDDLGDLYVPMLQSGSRFISVYARTDAAPGSWLESVRAAVGEIDPLVLVRGSAPLSLEAERQLRAPKFLASVLTGFAAVALLLAVLGNYAVVAYAVRQREREIAIRSALGATPRALTSLFLRQNAPAVATGLALGALGAIGVGRVLRSQLHGVAPFDPATVLAGCIAVGGVALLFVWWPARRAAAVSPAAALNES